MKHTFSKAIPILIITIILSSCSTMGSRISGDYSFIPKNNMGLIAISASLDDKCGSVGSFGYFIRNINDSGWDTPLIAKNPILTPDFQNPSGYFFVIELPAGNYKIAGVSVTGFTLIARSSFKDTGITFKVNPNQTTYIGEIEYTVTKSCNSYSYKIKNNWQRDRNLFANRVQNINPNSVKIRLAND